MIQDLSYGFLDNQYRHLLPQEDDLVVCVQGNRLLFRRNEDNTLALPTVKQVEGWRGNWEYWLDEPYRYVFTLQERRFFLWLGKAEQPAEEAFFFMGTREVREPESKDLCFGAMTAWHLYCWYRDNRFCGRCATPTEHDESERALVCPQCGRRIYPRILPAVIVAVTWRNETQDVSKILLTKYSPKTGHAFPYYALVAGFTEIGETLEGTVRREVFEETGLRVKNIRYYKSQPWSVVDDLLMGFFCEADTEAMQAENAAQNASEAILDANGDPVIHLDENELRTGVWLTPEEMTLQPDAYSLTNEMMLLFKAGRIHSPDDLPLDLTRPDIEELEQQFYGNRSFDQSVKL